MVRCARRPLPDASSASAPFCLTLPSRRVAFGAMPTRMLQLVLHYDGADFSGWQRQPDRRTVQGVLEAALGRLCARASRRARRGPHRRRRACARAGGRRARARQVGRRPAMRRALNALLPDDVWVAAAHAMRDEFHARFSATARAVQLLRGHGRGGALALPAAHEWACPPTASSAPRSMRRGVPRRRALASAPSPCAAPRPRSDDHRCDIHQTRSGERVPADWCSRSRRTASSTTWCASSSAR